MHVNLLTAVIIRVYRKVTFKNYEERVNAADKICRESEQMTTLFTRLLPKIMVNTRETLALASVSAYTARKRPFN